MASKKLNHAVDLTIQKDLLIDRLGITALPPGQERTLERGLAWFVLAVVYLLGYGASTIAAVSILLNNGVYEQPPYSVRGFVVSTMFDLVVIVIALVSIRHFLPNHRWRPVALSTSLRTLPVYHALPIIVMVVAACVASIVGLANYNFPEPQFPTSGHRILSALQGAMAGPCEELALLALPVVVLRRVGYSWTVVCVVAALMRVPFHMYYGWASILFATWAVGAVFLLRRTRALGAMIVSHSLHNLFIHLSAFVPGLFYANYALLIAGIGVVVWYCYEKRRWVKAAWPMSGQTGP